MAERRKPVTPAPPRSPSGASRPPRVSRSSVGAPPQPGDSLAELNDQMARFLAHADQLLDEWARFGAQVRTTVDREVEQLDQAMGEAVNAAVAQAGHQLGREVDEQVAARVDRSLGDGVTKLRGELDRLARTAGTVADASDQRTRDGGGRDPARLALIAALIADLLLVAVVVLVMRVDRSPAPPPAPAPAPVDAAVERACAELLAAWSDQAAARVIRAGTAACGPAAARIDTLLAERLAPPPVDAGVTDATDGGGAVDAGPPDAAPKRRPRSR